MNKTIKISILFAMAMALMTSCNHYDDFEFTGTVVDYELCNGINELGYAVDLSSPDSLGGWYMTQYGTEYHNVLIVYGSDRMLHKGDKISGRMYLEPNFSKTECSYRNTERNVSEAVFTKLNVL